MTKPEHKFLYKRQIVLLALLQAFGRRLSMRDFQKYLFLYTQLCESEKSYEFVPYKFGCFSFQSYADRRRLIATGAIEDGKYWKLATKDDFLSRVPQGKRAEIQAFANQYRNLRGNDLIRYVYLKYPYYATKSKIAAEKMTSSELEFIKKFQPANDDCVLFTIGYEGNTFENYLNRLIRNNIKMLCDVRRNPLSRKYGFSRSMLSDTLFKLDIKYIHFPELGIVSEKRRELSSVSDYQRLFDEYEATTLSTNQKALMKLRRLVSTHKRVAITCFEAEHCMCHRGRIANALARVSRREYKIQHI